MTLFVRYIPLGLPPLSDLPHKTQYWLRTLNTVKKSTKFIKQQSKFIKQQSMTCHRLGLS